MNASTPMGARDVRREASSVIASNEEPPPSSAARPGPSIWPRGGAARREAGAAYLFLSPWIIGFIVFTAGPMVASAYFSLTAYNVLQPPRWVGLDNYTQILTGDELFRQALKNTFIYALMFVPAHMLVALTLALLLNRNAHGTPIWRTLFYLPSITPVVAVAILWRALLNPNSGVINTVLGWVGIAGPGWTTDPSWLKPSLVFMQVWAVGGTMLIYLAGLKNIPASLYEAAAMDGAGRFSRFFHVTIPMLSSVLFFTAVINTIAAFQTFAEPAILFAQPGGDPNSGLQGGSGNAALLYTMYLFTQAFTYFRMGYASALAWILFVIIIAFTVLQFRLSSRWVYYEGGAA
jgi:multiple sugar transport system permease protein